MNVNNGLSAAAGKYITGWCMEQLFRVRYWDYSSQAFNLHGYICLSSSIAWGGLTLLLTEVIHKPVEFWIVNTSQALLLLWVLFISVFFILDTVQSVQAALNLAKVLDSMTHMHQPVIYSRAVEAVMPARKTKRRCSLRGRDTHSIITAPVPYRGSRGSRRNPRFTGRLSFRET